VSGRTQHTCCFTSAAVRHLNASSRQVDLINYGLIPEFVGRFPIICSLQVRLKIRSFSFPI